VGRILIDNFLGGMIDAQDTMRIPDNACEEIINYEYVDAHYPKMRKGLNDSELLLLGITSVSNIEVWYPRNFPVDCTGDKIYAFVADNKISIAYLTGDFFTKVDVFTTGISADSKIKFFPTQDRLLIADTANNGRYILFNNNKDLVSGYIGIKAPITIPYVSASGDDNLFALVSENDTGMTIERGNVLQYCYTIEDKFGAESNPSPIVTQGAMAYRYPEADVPGFKYYWYQTKISHLSASHYTPEEAVRFKYYNIYRRDADFPSGVIGKQFSLVTRVPITKGNLVSGEGIDRSPLSLRDISYDKNIAPAAEHIVSQGNVVFMAGLSSSSVRFPFDFDKYLEISIKNDNDTDYMNPVLTIKIPSQAVDITGFEPYLSSPHRMRLFFSDMTTPMPVVYKLEAYGALQIYTRVPYMYRTNNTLLYLCLADTSSGVTSSLWDDPKYGRFLDITDWTAGNNYVFDINRPQSYQHLICTNVPYTFASISYYGTLFNLSAMDRAGIVKSLSGTEQTYAPAGANQWLLKLYPYDEEISLGSGSYGIRIDRNVEYSLLNAPTLPFAFRYEGSYYAVGFASSNPSAEEMLYNALFNCGNFSVSAVHINSTSTVHFAFRIKHSEIAAWTTFATPPAVGYVSKTPIFISLSCYVSDTAIRIKYDVLIPGNDSVSGEYAGTIGVPIELSDKVYLNKSFYSSSEYFSVEREEYVVTRFDVINMPHLNLNDTKRFFLCLESGDTFFRSPVGRAVADEFDNQSISFELKEVKTEDRKNVVVWSDITGLSFPALNSKTYREPVTGIMIVPSYMRMEYQNTLSVYTRNTVNRIVLSDDLSTMAGALTNDIEEFSSGGLFAPGSLASGGGSVYWFSEAGVIKRNSESMQNLSYGVINIPIKKNYIGIWVTPKGQYILHDNETKISYVYHETFGVWTKFSGLNITHFAYLNLGEDSGNKILVYGDNGYFGEFPGTLIDGEQEYIIKTKRYPVDNRRAIRYRIRYDTINGDCTVQTENDFISGAPIVYTKSMPSKNRWHVLPTNMWGEYLQFVVDRVVGLRTIEVDIKEGV